MTEPVDDRDFELHAMYRIYDGFDRPLYFGETSNLPRRLAEHQEKSWFRRPDITIRVTWFPNRAEALIAESRAIAAEKPWHNKSGLKPAPGGEKKQSATEKRKRIATEKQQVVDEPPRDLLADLDQVLGQERVRLPALSHLLRNLVPEWEPYRALNGVKLHALLRQKGVRVLTTGGYLWLDPADLRRVYRKAA